MKFRKSIILCLSLATVFVLTGCGNLSTNKSNSSSSSEKKVTLTLKSKKIDEDTNPSGTATPNSTIHFQASSENAVSDSDKAESDGKFDSDHLYAGKYTVYASYHGINSSSYTLTVAKGTDKSNESESYDEYGSAYSDNSASYDATEGENNAENYSYGEFSKSDKWTGKSYHISKAQVLQADEDSGSTTLLVYTDDNADHLFMVNYEGTTKAVEDDYVDIQGVFTNRQTYDTKIGGENTVPALNATKITVTGKADN